MAGAHLYPGEVSAGRHTPGRGGGGLSDADPGDDGGVQAQGGRMRRSGRQLPPPRSAGTQALVPLL